MAAGRIYSSGRHLYPVPGREAGAKPFPFGMVPVIDATGWTNDQLRAYVIADNKIPARADWDLEMLRLELGDLREVGFDLDLTGFEPAEIEDLLRGGDGSGAGEGDGQRDNKLQLLVVSTDPSLIAEIKHIIGVPDETNRVSAHDLLRIIGAPPRRY